MKTAPPPLTPEQQERFDDFYPVQVGKLAYRKLGYLWNQFASDDDALASAAIGLLKAVRIYDPSHGTKFTTILHCCMRSSMYDGLRQGASKETIRNKSRGRSGAKQRKFASVGTVSISALPTEVRDDQLFNEGKQQYERTTEADKARETVCRIFGMLSYEDREVLHDFYFRRLSVSQIAWSRGKMRNELKIRLGTIRKRLRRHAAKMGVV